MWYYIVHMTFVWFIDYGKVNFRFYISKKKKTLKANIGDQALPTVNIDNAILENPRSKFIKLKSIKFNNTSTFANMGLSIIDYFYDLKQTLTSILMGDWFETRNNYLVFSYVHMLLILNIC